MQLRPAGRQVEEDGDFDEADHLFRRETGRRSGMKPRSYRSEV